MTGNGSGSVFSSLWSWVSGWFDGSDDRDRRTDLPKTDKRSGCYVVDSMFDSVWEVVRFYPKRGMIKMESMEYPRDRFYFHVEHLDSEGEDAKMLRGLDVGDCVEFDAIRYERDSSSLRFWCIENVHDVREPTGSERPVLR